jgi:hypothetical protein
MGANQSSIEQTSKAVNKIMTDIVSNSVASSTQSVKATQRLSFTDLDGADIKGVSMINDMKATLTSSQSAKVSADISTAMGSQLKQKLDAKFSGLNLAVGDTSRQAVNSAVENLTNNNVVQNTMQQAVQSFDMNQTLEFARIRGGKIEDIKMQATTDLTATIAQALDQSVGLSAAIQNVMDQDTTVKTANPIADVITSGMEGIAKILSVPAGAMQNIVIAIVIGIAFVLYSFFNFGGVDVINKGISPMRPMMPPPMMPPPMMPPPMMPPPMYQQQPMQMYQPPPPPMQMQQPQ